MSESAPSTCPLIHSSSKPIHSFFKTLSSHPRFLSKYFVTHFPSSSPVCDCQRFPVYASKFPPTAGSPTKSLHPALSHLCLVCARSYTNSEYAGSRLNCLWSRQLENEWSAHYMRFYTQMEEANFRRAEGNEGWFKRTDFTLNRIWPVLKALGGPILGKSVLLDSGSEEEEEEELSDAELEDTEETTLTDPETQKQAWMQESRYNDPYLTFKDMADPESSGSESDGEVAGDFE